MPFREQPLDIAAAPKRYPAPDYDKPGLVYRLRMPDDTTIGFLFFQKPNRIEWYGTISRDNTGYSTKTYVSELLRAGAREGRSVGEVRDDILNSFLYVESAFTQLRQGLNFLDEGDGKAST